MRVEVVFYSRYYNIANFIDNYVHEDIVTHAVDAEGMAPTYDGKSKFIFICPTYEPDYVAPAFKFMEEHGSNCVGIVGSGDRNYGAIYLYSVFELAMKHDIKVYMGIENMGLPHDGEILDNLTVHLATGEDTGQITTQGIDTEFKNYIEYKKAGNVEWHNPL